MDEIGLKDVNYIDIFEIKKNLKGAFVGKNIYYEEKVDSTNTLARELSLKGVKNGSVVISDYQERGRGRNGKIWTSPCGCNIYMSIILKPKFSPEVAQGMTILAAVSVADAIAEVASLKPQIKWPNDILIDSKKVSGILTEMSTQNMIIEHIIVGIGINVNAEEKDMEDGIKNIATSLLIESKKTNEFAGPLNRNKLITSILNKFDKYYEMFLSTGLSSVLQYYQKYFSMIGKEIEINIRDKRVKGQVVGIDSKGALLLKTGENELEKVVSGEIYF
ncbi:MAG: biotin--[acetyl-CoA-carboxylase] ligase [Deltaproteobacteria bacterium]|jgi:BirA family biotin operon repressor/biotin-[acetyl-CoA-carboxylase] ligase|nr:biotin--[acetyl-CoA-carboxylase] ligase [Deltaproteobacteria bacterium]MCL5880642.1 biotin--[acetyl-CoA-carboxylase] ligase [Deltaproteobacteria bacterium]MDA8305153.1 biotin--[acetyl-CoA-carboxylase] ligase [Deltaproteobacteria bacterium]